MIQRGFDRLSPLGPDVSCDPYRCPFADTRRNYSSAHACVRCHVNLRYDVMTLRKQIVLLFTNSPIGLLLLRIMYCTGFCLTSTLTEQQ